MHTVTLGTELAHKKIPVFGIFESNSVEIQHHLIGL